ASVATFGTVTVTDTVPAGLTLIGASGTGWNCSTSGQAITCTRTDALAAGQSYPVIEIAVNVDSDAATSVTNTATVSGTHNAKTDASVTPDASGKVFGASEQTLTGTLNGFIASDNVTASYSRTSGEDVSGNPYTISATLSSTGLLSNYNITYNTANFNITKAP